MKLRNIFIAGLSVAAFASCSDYLNVDAPSKNDSDYVMSDKKEINRALNGVYAAMLNNDTYGNNFIEKLSFNTDVEYATSGTMSATSNGYRRYDCDPDGGEVKKVWDALYTGIERANMLDSGIKEQIAKGTYAEDDADILQILGEVKTLRAIFYHDLCWYYGDVPFTMVPSYEAESIVFPVAPREQILKTLIDDLKAAAVNMKFTNTQGWEDGSRRIGKEATWALIARLAMTAGGYSLRPDGSNVGKMTRVANYKDFYKTAADYCDSVITKGGHSLNLPYHQVFVNECNFIPVTNDDILFEIPFADKASGNIGYVTGPKMDSSSGETPHAWGKVGGGAQLNAHYQYFFDPDDRRVDYINQQFQYTALGEANLNNGRTVYNGKWSKLWNANGLGSTTEGATGIGFPYLRYADVLLMAAEALNELNEGPTPEAISYLETVRDRAFRYTDPSKVAQPDLYGSKEDFLKAVLNERKFEFAGENMRWRDLVRNNMLAQEVYMSFFRYWNTAEGGGDYSDAISMYDFNDENAWPDKLVYSIYYYNNVKNADEETGAPFIPAYAFPQTAPNVNVCRIINLRRKSTNDDTKVRMTINGKSTAPTRADFMSWYDDNLNAPRQDLCYSMRGYVYYDVDGDQKFHLKQANGNYGDCPMPNTISDLSTLPPVRYILPYPRAVITRSQGKYTQSYGYR